MLCNVSFVVSCFNAYLKIALLHAGILFAKKRLYTEHAREINKIKGEIDKCKRYLENCTRERHRLGKFISSINCTLYVDQVC